MNERQAPHSRTNYWLGGLVGALIGSGLFWVTVQLLIAQRP